MMKLSILWVTASFLATQHAFAFAPVASKIHENGVLIRSAKISLMGRTTLAPLQYRALDEDDDESVMMKTQNRAPKFGYDMRKAVAAKAPKTAMNLPLIRALLANQSLILGIATAITYGLLLFTDGFDGISHMREFLHWTGGPPSDINPLTALGIGAIAGAAPMLAFSNTIENSDKPEYANVNFSTILMVMTLFGRRKAPPQDFIPKKIQGIPVITTKTRDAFFQSFSLALTTGLCEETVFRQQVPALIAHYTGNTLLLPLIGQAALFGLGHASPRVSLMENGIVIGIQTINGLVHGLLYVSTGGNIIPCIVAHSIYDFVVFFKTWLDANAQLEYAERMYLEPLEPELEKEVKKVKIDPQVLKAMKRLFYTFDFDKNKTLSLSEVRKGFAYMAIERQGKPPKQEDLDAIFQKVADPNTERLSFPGFLRMFSMTMTKQPRPAVAA